MSEYTKGPREVYSTTSGFVVGTSDGELTIFRNRGDALLDAAAPDLLEAAKAIVEAWRDGHGGTLLERSKLAAAVEKAEGKS